MLEIVEELQKYQTENENEEKDDREFNSHLIKENDNEEKEESKKDKCNC